jgi:hypothetical protein
MDGTPEPVEHGRVNDFDEIALSGERIRFTREQGGMSLRFEHSRPEPVSSYLVCASTSGELLDEVPCPSMGAPLPPHPEPSILVCMISDREGMFGRLCPRCNLYFRTACAGETHCPYCGVKDRSVAFATPNQREFVKAYCRAFLDASRGNAEVEINLDALVEQLPANRPAWVYTEERQQTKFTCVRCNTDNDILGTYGACPHCGHRNNKDLFSQRMAALRRRFDDADRTLGDRQEREARWSDMTRAAVAEFEALGNDLKDSLARLPATPRRRQEIKELSFQHIVRAAEKLLQWYGIGILEGVGEEDRQFIVRMFNVRHLLTHKAGRVDQEYLDNTGDTSVRPNQTIRVRSREVRRLLEVVDACGARMAQGYERLFHV